MTESIRGLDTLPNDVALEIREAFNRQLNERVQSAVSALQIQLDTLNETKRQLLKERKEFEQKAIQDSKEVLQEEVERLVKKRESKMIREAQEVVVDEVERIEKENEVPKMQQEQYEKVEKVLALFEEMIKTLGLDVQQVLTDADNEAEEELEEAEEVVEELEEKVEELEEEVETLKEAVRAAHKNNCILEAAHKYNISDLDGFKAVARGLVFKTKVDFNKSVSILAENFSKTSSTNLNNGSPTSFMSRINESVGNRNGGISNTHTEPITYSKWL